MLHEGGNTIDAAVAATLALCVVIPGSVGLGGYGGSAVMRVAGSMEREVSSRGAIGIFTCSPKLPRYVGVSGIIISAIRILFVFHWSSSLAIRPPKGGPNKSSTVKRAFRLAAPRSLLLALIRRTRPT